MGILRFPGLGAGLRFVGRLSQREHESVFGVDSRRDVPAQFGLEGVVDPDIKLAADVLAVSAGFDTYKECPIDLAVVLDVPVDVGLERQRAMGKPFDVMESMGLPARERIRHGFLEVSKELDAATVVDADRPLEEVYRDVRTLVMGAMGKK